MKTILIASVIALIGSSLSLYPYLVYIISGLTIIFSMLLTGAIRAAQEPLPEDKDIISTRLSSSLSLDSTLKNLVFEIWMVFIFLIISLVFHLGILLDLFFSAGLGLLSYKIIVYIDEEYGDQIQVISDNIRARKK
jgi:hypothetical protein